MSKTLNFSIALVALAAPAAGSAQDPNAPPAAAAAAPKPAKTMVIYKNALGEGWQNKSSAATELAVDAGASRKPIRVEAGPGQALYLHHEPLSVATYRKLSMLIQSAPPGGPSVRIVALAGGKPVAGTAKEVALKPGGWTKVEVPLASLGVDQGTIDGIGIENGTGQPLPVFYVADVSLD